MTAQAGGHPGARVSNLELFFDLVFVFTITQVALILEHQPRWPNVGQAALELLVIYWMYGGYAWLTNTVAPSTLPRRLLLLAGMAAFLVVSLTVPRAFDDDGIAFGVAYLVLTAIHFVGFVVNGNQPTVRAMMRVGATNMTAALLILVAGFENEGTRWTWWMAAVAVQILPPVITRGSGRFAIDVEHFAERHGLMIIIALGESIVSVALASQELAVGASLITGALCGLAASAAMWWAYFDRDADRAASAFADRPSDERGTIALTGYDAPHVVMIAGIIGVAAGTRLSLPELTGSTTTPAAVLIAGGTAVYLGGLAFFRVGLGFAAPFSRLLGAGAAAALIPVGTSLSAAVELLAAAVVIVAVIVSDRLVISLA